MIRARKILWAVVLVTLASAASMALRPVELWALRGLYQFGEWAGITPVAPEPGATLGGQVAGYNFWRPPAWWGFTSGIVAIAVSVASLLAVLLWVHSLRWREARRPRGWWLACAAAMGGLIAGVVHRFGEGPLLWGTIDVFEWMGGQVPRISGMVNMGPGGPFSGNGWADHAGNWAVRWASWLVPVVAGAAGAVMVHRLRLRRPDESACRGCGYDRRGLQSGAACPECGERPVGIGFGRLPG